MITMRIRIVLVSNVKFELYLRTYISKVFFGSAIRLTCVPFEELEEKQDQMKRAEVIAVCMNFDELYPKGEISMYLKNKELLVEILEDEGAILFDQHTEKTFILNNMGYYIWNNIEGSTVDNVASEIYDNMSNKGEYTFDKVHEYVKNYVTSLTESGLVVHIL